MTGFIEYLLGKCVFTVDRDVIKNHDAMRLLRGYGINEMSYHEDGISFFVNHSKAKKIKRGLCNLEIPFDTKEKGIAITVNKLLRRKGIIAGIVVVVVLHFLFSNIIFHIAINGSEKVSEQEALILLSSLGVEKGDFFRFININDLSNDFVIAEDRVVKMHMNMKGNTADIVLSDRLEAQGLPKDKNDIMNIVAKCDGMIIRSDAYSGKNEVYPGDVVSKGDLLISPFFETRVAGNIIKRAKGTVFARTERVYEIRIPKKMSFESERVDTLEKRLVFLDRDYPIKTNISRPSYQMINKDSEEKNVSFLMLELPFGIKNETKHYSDYVTKDRTYEQAKVLFDKKLEQIKNYMKDVVAVEKTELENEENSEFYVFRVRFYLLENIAEERPLDIKPY